MDYYKVKAYIKNKLTNLPDYSFSEEDILLEELFLETKEKLLLKEFSNKDINKINKIIKIRLMGKPLNKIFKSCYFYKDKFYINNKVLAPRQETEILVEHAIKIINNLNKNCAQVLDLCCGSGIIGLSVAKYSTNNCFVTLLDISKSALRVCKKNVKNLNLLNKTKLIKSNLLEGLKHKEKFDIILSNPPYIKTADINNLSIGVKKYDPKLALDGGEDGLKFYKNICENCKKFLTENGTIIVEIGFNQGLYVENLFNKNGFKTKLVKDYSNNDRVIIAKNKGKLSI